MRAPLAALASLLLVLVAVPFASSPASAATASFAVDCSARRSGDGSTGRPWNTLDAVNAHGAFAPGDRILLKRGTRCRGRLHPSGSGAAGAPIVLGAYGSGAKPLVAAGGSPDFTAAIQLLNQQYWTIQDIHVTNTAGKVSTEVYRSGVAIRDQDGGALHGLVVQRMDVTDVTSAPNEKHGSSREWGGITVAAGGVQDDSFPGLVIRDNRVDHVGRTGIMVANWENPPTRNTGVRITGNRVSWTRGDGIVVFGAQDSRIDHNLVHHAADEWPCPLCGPITPLTANAGIWPARSSDIRIDHNEVYGVFAKGGDGEAFDVDQHAVDVVFEYNYAHDNQGGGILFCGSVGATARFNIFQNNLKSAFAFIANVPASGTRIYNNTVYAKKLSGTRPVRTFNGVNASDVYFANNIVEHHAIGEWKWPSTNITTAANTLVGNHGAGRPHDALTSTRNPGLKDAGSGRNGLGSLGGYRPRAGSALQGVPIPADVTTDFFGERIDPQRPPRGAAG